MLDRIRIVMVETTHPGNIGAAARAMKTMGLSDLRLVSPKAFPNAEELEVFKQTLRVHKSHKIRI